MTSLEYPASYRAIQIDGLSIFYRVLDAGHFALDTAADQIAQLVRGFMK